MLVVSEFVGCSPSLSGAIRVNPWNVDSVADGIYSAIKMTGTCAMPSTGDMSPPTQQLSGSR